MLLRDKLRDELERKRDRLADDLREQASLSAKYLEILERFCTATPDEINDRLGGSSDCGAFPAEPRSGDSFAVSFGTKWTNHEAAREWAAEILTGRTTFAADGSQLYVEKETTLPIGAVQIGWLENPHDASKAYEKGGSFELLTPNDLLSDSDEPFDPSTKVGERRFYAEAERVGEFLSKHKGWQDRGERMPLAFFDGTLLVSFSLPRTTLQKNFVRTMVNLVRHSRDVRVPVIGYIDRSFARDLVTMLEQFSGSAEKTKSAVYDAGLLNRRAENGERILPDWGDHTPFFYSRRSGLADYIDSASGNALVGFSYLQTTADAAPARLDIPAWIYDDGLLDELVDVVRAECIVGLGYPYPLEAADQAALISGTDRDVFFRALQDFATREKLDFSVSRKNASKARRRG